MEPSEARLLSFLGWSIVLGSGLVLASCASRAVVVAPADAVVVPTPKAYTCAMEQRLNTLYPGLPADVQVLIDDYAQERKKLAAAAKLTLACVK